MKTKEEILDSYYTLGADGMPEISADKLLQAMEDYRRQAEEAAFTAARLLRANEQAGDFEFADFESYKASLATPKPAEPDEAATIQFMADSILEIFLPNDPATKTVTFNIKAAGKTYEVTYLKSEEGYWAFNHHREA